MGTLELQLAVIALYTVGSTCDPSCTLSGLKADCGSRSLHWVPDLPPNITHLYLNLNYIREINSTALRGYQQLQELDLGWQRIPSLTIRSNAFLRQRKLTTLILGSNRLLQLEPRTFAGLFGLRRLITDFCDLSDAILSDSFLQPLLSLETLDLSLNNIKRLLPGQFFTRLAKLTVVNLRQNKIERLCEEDLAGFRGKHFTVLNLESNPLGNAYDGDGVEQNCGNPFRDMTFQLLDLSLTGFNVNKSREFFKAIQGTSISHLIFSGHIGQDFSFKNLPDPEELTFEGLVDSNIDIFDMSKNRIFALRRAVFSCLKVARIIDVSENRINLIEKKAFSGLQGHLRMLNLSLNLLGEVRSDTFADLEELRVLDLSYNHIGALGYRAFSDLPKLRALYLTGNSLRALGFPALLPQLDFLLLGDNKLDKLYGIRDFANHSVHVDVSNNRLTNLEDVYSTVSSFSRLERFFYSGNVIRWCTVDKNFPVPENNTLKVLDLSHNFLEILWTQGKCLDLFDRLHYLLSLSLSSNLLTRIPPGVLRGLSSITELFLSSNSLTFLQPDDFPLSLRRLDLSNNFLAHPDPAMFRSLFFLDLAENRFHCDCHLETFLHWLNVTNVTLLGLAQSYRCEFPAALRNVPLLAFTTVVEPCDVPVQELMFALFLLSALLVLTVTLSGFVYARLRGRIFIMYKKVIGRVVAGPKTAPPARELQYDVFFCFSNSDYGWVEAALLKKLDNQFEEDNFFQCCFEARDFLPGEDHLSNIRDAIWGSRKTVCVISKEFLKDGWCLEAFTLAQSRMMEELTNILILLVVGKVAHYQLMRFNSIRTFIEKREYLRWPEDPQDLEWFYERLVAQILKHTEVKKFAEERPQPAQQQHGEQHQDHMDLQEMGTAAM